MESPAVISRSTAFLLAEIRRIFNEREERSDRIFAAHEERWDRRFSSPRSTAASAAPASGLEPASTPSATVPATSVPLTGASTPASSTAVPSVATTPAPTSELASHTNISKRGINSSSHAQVVDGDRKEMEVDEFLDSGLSASRPRRAPLRQHRPRRPRRAPRCVRRLRRPLRAPLRPPRPRRPRQAPLRPVQPLRRRPPRPPCSPTKCSTICLSRPIDLLQSVNTRATRWTLPPTSLHFTAERCCLFGRYITIITPSLSSGAVLLCVSTEIDIAQKVFEVVSVQNSRRPRRGRLRVLRLRRPRRAPPRPPRPRHPRRAPQRVPRPRRPCHAPLHPVRLLRLHPQHSMTQHSDNANDSPTSCSTECFSCVAGELVPRTTEVLPVVEFRDVPKHVEPLPVAMLATASKHSSIFIADRVVGGAVQQRYLTSLVPAYLMDVVLLGSASEVSEGMTSQSTIASSTWVDVQIVQRVQFLPVSRSLETTHLFDTASFLLWPSVCSPSPTEFQRTISEHPMLILVGLGSFLKFPSSYMRPRALETIRSWNTLWPPFSLGWFVILLRQPWPPPIPVEMLVCSADSFLKLQADWFSEWKLPWVSLVCINNISCCSRRVFLLLDGNAC